jgi:diguanylate cyclase (GGDEF)-like protein
MDVKVKEKRCMGSMMVLTIFFPSIIVSLLITIDTVFSSVKKVFSNKILQLILIILLYFTYLFCLLSLSVHLLGAVYYEYSLILFIAYYFFRSYGKYLILLTPFLLVSYSKLIDLRVVVSYDQLFMIALLIFSLFVVIDWLPFGWRNLKFSVLFILSMLISAYFHLQEVGTSFFAENSGTIVLLITGSLVILVSFYLYFSLQEKGNARIREELIASKIDRLTGVHNYSALSDMIEFLKEHKQVITVAMLDLDHFKKINDQNGHLVGNEVLRDFVQLLEAHLSLYLDKNNVEIYRFGGEEFCIFFYDSSKNSAYKIIEEFRAKIETYPMGVGMTDGVSITFSAGIENTINQTDILETLKKADEACYIAKQSGRNKVVIYHNNYQ